MLRRIHLHGALKSIHPEPIEVNVATVAEAIELITGQLPGFQPNAIHGRREIQVAGFSTAKSLYAPTDVQDIHLFPPLAFGKNGGIFKMIVGVALVIVGVIVSAIPGFQAIGGALVSLGLSLVIGGLAQLLSPQPSNTPEQRSKYLSNNQNTVQIGTPIPLLYGERRVAGQILSLNVQSQDTNG